MLYCVAALGLPWSLPASMFGAESKMHSMTDDQLRAYRAKRVAELEKRPVKRVNGEYRRVFFCTIYYTPLESGFTKEDGFDVTPVAAPGLGGRKYPQAFLNAVRMEGVGRLKEPVRGFHYIAHSRDRYKFVRAPIGVNDRPLIPRNSCAVSRKNLHLPRGARLRIKSDFMSLEVGSDNWRAIDTGSGLHPRQIDLYWGEDAPRGPIGRNLARPKGTIFEYSFEVDVIVNPQEPPKPSGKQDRDS